MSHRYISALALIVIVSGCAYAYKRETLRSSLDDRFDHINAVYFNHQLSVRARWGFLDDDYGVANDDGTIVVDSSSVRDGVKLDEVLKHESCHEFVGVEHQHDEDWQACMERFSK